MFVLTQSCISQSDGGLIFWMHGVRVPRTEPVVLHLVQGRESWGYRARALRFFIASGL